MSEHEEPMEQEVPDQRGPSQRLIVALVVVAIFAGLFAAKVMLPSPAKSPDASTTGSLTATHNDAMADYQAAIATGRPVYVLFHSLTWQSCVEISAVADRVIPSYKGKIEFVNALTDDEAGRRLAEKLPFQYIPTSFFLGRGGQVVDTYSGPLTEQEMRLRLDSLLAEWRTPEEIPRP